MIVLFLLFVLKLQNAVMGYLVCGQGQGVSCTSGPGYTRCECAPCPTGYYNFQSSNLGGCTPCAPGKYSSFVGAQGCNYCTPGKFSTAVAATSEATCQPCQQGKYTPTSGMTDCSLCQVGTFSAAQGLSACSFMRYRTLFWHYSGTIGMFRLSSWEVLYSNRCHKRYNLPGVPAR